MTITSNLEFLQFMKIDVSNTASISLARDPWNSRMF